MAKEKAKPKKKDKADKDETKKKKKPSKKAEGSKKSKPKKEKPKKSSSKNAKSKKKISPEERMEMIRTAAYYLAQKRGHEGSYELDDWIEAEKEIDTITK